MHSGKQLIKAILTLWVCGLSIVWPTFARERSPIAIGAASLEETTPPIKNLILMIGDGMGYNHIQAAGYYAGNSAGESPIYQAFTLRLGMSTYAYGGSYDPAQAWSDFEYVTGGATDLAAAATALSTGFKTSNGAIGVDPGGKHLTHTLELAEQSGKASGLVTSVQFSHATPAGFAAHSLSRANYANIANELIYTATLEVLMGAGHPCYDKDGLWNDCANSTQYVGGAATWEDLKDGIVLGADANGDGTADEWSVSQARDDFLAFGSGLTPARVLGLAQTATTLQQARSGDGLALPFAVPQIESVPRLAEMARAALNVLDEDPDGFFLMVEGGAIDWASHANQSGRMIEEQIAFNAAVAEVVAWVEARSTWDETLLIVTGDHETGYLTGPGSNPGWQPLVNNGAGALPGLEWHNLSHTNSLIPLYGRGAGAELLAEYIQASDPQHGSYLDNTAIGVFMQRVLTADDQTGGPLQVYLPLVTFPSSH